MPWPSQNGSRLYLGCQKDTSPAPSFSSIDDRHRVRKGGPFGQIHQGEHCFLVLTVRAGLTRLKLRESPRIRCQITEAKKAMLIIFMHHCARSLHVNNHPNNQPQRYCNMTFVKYSQWSLSKKKISTISWHHAISTYRENRYRKKYEIIC